MAELQNHIDAIQRYVEGGIEPGSCTRAILENDLFRAARSADPTSRLLLADIVDYLHNCVPFHCWGSPAKVAQWIRTKRAELEKPNVL